jgi:hypothetical protein
MRKPSIPAVVNLPDQKIASLLRPMKENLEIMNGTRTGKLAELPATATLSDVISKVNALIDRLNA